MIFIKYNKKGKDQNTRKIKEEALVKLSDQVMMLMKDIQSIKNNR